jgi:hypothetical protein
MARLFEAGSPADRLQWTTSGLQAHAFATRDRSAAANLRFASLTASCAAADLDDVCYGEGTEAQARPNDGMRSLGP